MKKIISIFFVALSVVMVSCDDKEFLSIENPNSPDVVTSFSDVGGAISNLIGAYSALQLQGTSGAIFSNTATMLSADAMIGNFIATSQINDFGNLTYDQNNNWGNTIYIDTYRLIFRANSIIDNLEKSDSEVPEPERSLILGQAKFLRGLGLFWAANTFNGGNIVVPNQAIQNSADANLPLTERSVVFQEIIADLIEARNLLDPSRPISDDFINARNTFFENSKSIGFADFYAVRSLLGKVYLYNNQNNLAKEEFKEVVENGGYSLVSNIGDNFNIAGERNTESIFEVPYAITVPLENFGGGEGAIPNEATLRATHQARAFGGFSYIFTSHFISTLYRNEVIDETLFSPDLDESVVYVDQETFNKRNDTLIEPIPSRFSRRSRASVVHQGEATEFYTQTAVTATNDNGGNFIAVPSRSQLRKFMNWELNAEPRGRSGINERIIRLADVKLMYAEAILKDEGDGGIGKAIDEIDAVRTRAGLVGLRTLFAGVDVPPIVNLATSDSLNTEIRVAVEEAIKPIIESFPLDTDEEIINAATEPVRQQIIEAARQESLSILPEILKIPAKAVTAENIIEHLFNNERPAELAFEGHGISWFDLRRRPGGPEPRIRELIAQDYEAVTVDLSEGGGFKTLPQFRAQNLTDFNKGNGINTSSQIIRNLYLFIPISELQENTRIGERGDLLLN